MKKKHISAVFLFPILFLLGGYVALREAAIKNDRLELEKVLDDRRRLEELNDVWKAWFAYKLSGGNIADFFVENGYTTVAIYGMKELGINLYQELSRQGISVKYGIDRNTDISVKGLRVIEPTDSYDEVDVVVVTPVHYFAEIAELLNEKVNCPIVSIENVINYHK